MNKVILIGAGGHSKSVRDAATSSIQVIGYIDDIKTGTYFGLPILGNRIEQIGDYQSYSYFVTIGDNNARKTWFERIRELGLNTINIIDPSAVISPSASIGTGNFIGKHVVVNSDSRIGDNNILNTRSTVEHECVVGNHTHISTGAIINGNVEIGDGVFLGSMSICIGQLCVGDRATVGAGAVVIGDIEPDVTAVGVPARIIKHKGVRI